MYSFIVDMCILEMLNTSLPFSCKKKTLEQKQDDCPQCYENNWKDTLYSERLNEKNLKNNNDCHSKLKNKQGSCLNEICQ